MSVKAQFIRDYVIRNNPTMEKLDDVIGQGEKLFDVLCMNGYGLDEPKPSVDRGSWDGLPPAKPRPLDKPYPYTNPKSEPTHAERLQAAKLDVQHWKQLSAMSPGDENITTVLEGAQRTLDNLLSTNP